MYVADYLKDEEEAEEHWLVGLARQVLREGVMKGVINCKIFVTEELEEIGEDSPQFPQLKRARRDLNRWLEKANDRNAQSLMERAASELESAKENLERVQEGVKTESQLSWFFIPINHQIFEARRCLRTLREKKFYIPFVTEHEAEIALVEEGLRVVADEHSQLKEKLVAEARDREADVERKKQERIRLKLEARDREVSQQLDEAENALEQGNLGTATVLLEQCKGAAVNELSNRRIQLLDRLLELSTKRVEELHQEADKALVAGNAEVARRAVERLAAFQPEVLIGEFGSLDQAKMYIQRCRRRFAEDRRKPKLVK